jgi:hypothetical protein
LLVNTQVSLCPIERGADGISCGRIFESLAAGLGVVAAHAGDPVISLVENVQHLAFQDALGWPVGDTAEKLDGEFLLQGVTVGSSESDSAFPSLPGGSTRAERPAV